MLRVLDFDKAIQLKPDFATAYTGRGLAKGLLGAYKSAILDFDAAIELKPEDANAYCSRGLVKYELGAYDVCDFRL